MSRRFVTEFTGVGVPPYSGTGFSLTEKLIGGTGTDVEETGRKKLYTWLPVVH